MDITILFKACVKTVRTTNKNLDLKDAKTGILKLTHKDVNLKKAKDILKDISNLQQFFLENKFAYLNVINYLSTTKTMIEAEKEQIDTEAQKIINLCTNNISVYREELLRNIKSKQLEEHYTNVLTSLERYLKSVSKMYAEAKAIRVKKVIETHKLSKLETINVKRTKSIDAIPKDDKKPAVPEKEVILPPSPPPTENIEDQLSPEEIQMFESENEHLYNELNSLSDEVKHMESKVVHIAELQELFTQKVLQQEKDIERISTTVANTTDDMKLANEQIKQAIQRNAGLRVWVLFFLLVMSFSLLFLDWYND
ncbi:syntaxin-18 [Holotrichia oblita]|uniref:Syntaxin-18 n=1 Tax=Holotrichia oblita TaxID=644536 RepID=A0ACB9SUD5_HOLOL|nr:syntaxin-18 [Holotrichia oblita]